MTELKILPYNLKLALETELLFWPWECGGSQDAALDLLIAPFVSFCKNSGFSHLLNSIDKLYLKKNK